MKKILILLFLISCNQAEVAIPNNSSSFNLTGKFNYFPKSTRQNQVIHHNHYSLSYSERHEQAEWIAYELTKFETQGTVKRSNNFRADPSVSSGSAALKDYKGSGYDRGHLAPAGDMKFSKLAMSESFFMSNMSPQKPSFNRGIWKKLESRVRGWAVQNEVLYVITGPVLNVTVNNSHPKTIGRNKITVPFYYYKVLLDLTEPEIKAIAFLLPNKKSTAQLEKYVVPIDEVERLTDLDFFYDLPDELENQLESSTNIKDWFN